MYVTFTPPFEKLNGTLPRLKYEELASEEVARERSPIPPARASGEIRKKGTAVVTTFIGSAFWAIIESEFPVINRIRKVPIRKAVDFIVLF